MSKILWKFGAVIFGISILMLVGCAMTSRVGDITYVTGWDNTPVTTDQTTKPGAQTKVRIKAYVTGWVEAPADILIDQSNPRVPESLRKPQWVPSLAYTVTHPTKGVVILDTGLRAGPCDYGQRPLYWVPCRNEPGSDLVSQLKSEGIDGNAIKAIILSHFHGDHVSGLKALMQFTDAPLLAPKASIKDLRSPLRALSGIPGNMVTADMKIEVMDGFWKQDAWLGVAMDVFGDGSLKVFQTSGHTDGHISALAQGVERPVLMTFDAAHLKANFDLGIPSGAVGSSAEAISSIQHIQTLASQSPTPQIIYGHEPAQWDCVPRSADVGLWDAVAC